MDLNLNGKNALVSASSQGIGKAIATSLSESGVNVSIFSRDAKKLDEAKKDIQKVSSGKVIATVCDLASTEDIKNVVQITKREFGSIDILVNNQGGPKPGKFEEISEEDIQDAFAINLNSSILLTRLCIGEMKSKKWGRVINILSISAKEPLPNMLLSNTIRPAVVGFSKTLSKEYAEFGITINNILPSSVMTERTNFFINQNSKKNNTSFEEELVSISETLPPKYIAKPEQIADLAIFLASDKSSYINGTSISVDGGSSRGLL